MSVFKNPKHYKYNGFFCISDIDDNGKQTGPILNYERFDKKLLVFAEEEVTKKTCHYIDWNVYGLESNHIIEYEGKDIYVENRDGVVETDGTFFFPKTEEDMFQIQLMYPGIILMPEIDFKKFGYFDEAIKRVGASNHIYGK